jgi:hypothetical protein
VDRPKTGRNRFISLPEMDNLWRDASGIPRGTGVMDQSWFDWGSKKWNDPVAQAEHTGKYDMAKTQSCSASTRSSSTLGTDSQENIFLGGSSANMDFQGRHRELGWNPRDAESSWTKAWRTGNSPHLPAISKTSSRRYYAPTSSAPLGSMGIHSSRSKRDECLEQIAHQRPAGRMTPYTSPTRVSRRSHSMRANGVEQPLTPDHLSQIGSSDLQEQLQNLRPAGVPSGANIGGRQRPVRMRNPSGTIPPAMPWRC